MKMYQFVMSTFAVTLVLLATILVLPRSSTGTDSSPPVLDVPEEIKQGTALVGSASDPDIPVVVTATYNGSVIGSDSSTGSNGVNSFSFPTTGIPVGGQITITATDDCGNQAVTTVEVVRCPQIIP